MKKLILYLLLLVSISVHADTIPVLSVYYNKVKIKELDLSKGNELTIDSRNYRPGDYMAIQYADGAKCTACRYEIVVVAEGKIALASEKFKDKNQLVIIDLKPLLDHKDDFKIKDALFVIYRYTIDKKGKKDNGPRVMTLHIL